MIASHGSGDDLFALEGQGEFYSHIRTNDEFKETRAFVESLWRQYQPYADTNFLDEIRGEGFFTRFWEMYLTCALLEHHLPVLKREGVALPKKGKNYGPDVCIVEKPRIWIEAVVPHTGNGADRVPGGGSKEDYSVPDEEVKLRYLSVIRDKSKEHNRYVHDGWVGESDPFVIAVNGLIFTSVPDELWPRIVRALFGLGNPYVTIDRATRETVGGGYTSRRGLAKKSGSLVNSAPFLPPEFEGSGCNESNVGISAIIFSNVSPSPTLGSWFESNNTRMADAFVVIHNPNARNPLQYGQIPCKCEYRFVENESGGEVKRYLLDDLNRDQSL